MLVFVYYTFIMCILVSINFTIIIVFVITLITHEIPNPGNLAYSYEQNCLAYGKTEQLTVIMSLFIQLLSLQFILFDRCCCG